MVDSVVLLVLEFSKLQEHAPQALVAIFIQNFLPVPSW